MAAIAGDADQVLKAVAKILASASSTGKHRSTSKKVQRVSTNNVPPSHSRVGKQLKFLVHIAMSSAYLIFIYEAQKHHDRGSHWEERMVEANEEKKRERKERKNKHKVGRENLSSSRACLHTPSGAKMCSECSALDLKQN